MIPDTTTFTIVDLTTEISTQSTTGNTTAGSNFIYVNPSTIDGYELGDIVDGGNINGGGPTTIVGKGSNLYIIGKSMLNTGNQNLYVTPKSNKSAKFYAIPARYDSRYSSNIGLLLFRNYGILSISVSTTQPTNITTTTATGGGYVYSNVSVTAYGVAWSSTNATPTIANSHTTDGSFVGAGTATFASNLTGLVQNTLYYVRAYATTAGGTTYGSVFVFTTLATATLPTVTTTAITVYSDEYFTGGGTLVSTGNATVTAMGLVWSRTANPTTSSNMGLQQHRVGMGAWSDVIHGLNFSETYHVRAYATNSVGTAYGADVTVTMQPSLVVFVVANASAYQNQPIWSVNGTTFYDSPDPIGEGVADFYWNPNNTAFVATGTDTNHVGYKSRTGSQNGTYWDGVVSENGTYWRLAWDPYYGRWLRVRHNLSQSFVGYSTTDLVTWTETDVTYLFGGQIAGIVPYIYQGNIAYFIYGGRSPSRTDKLNSVTSVALTTFNEISGQIKPPSMNSFTGQPYIHLQDADWDGNENDPKIIAVGYDDGNTANINSYTRAVYYKPSTNLLTDMGQIAFNADTYPTLVANNKGQRIKYNGTRWVAKANNLTSGGARGTSTAYSSDNGVTWNAVDSFYLNADSAFSSLEWNGYMWTETGSSPSSSSSYRYSYDGITWINKLTAYGTFTKVMMVPNKYIPPLP